MSGVLVLTGNEDPTLIDAADEAMFFEVQKCAPYRLALDADRSRDIGNRGDTIMLDAAVHIAASNGKSVPDQLFRRRQIKKISRMIVRFDNRR